MCVTHAHAYMGDRSAGKNTLRVQRAAHLRAVDLCVPRPPTSSPGATARPIRRCLPPTGARRRGPEAAARLRGADTSPPRPSASPGTPRNQPSGRANTQQSTRRTCTGRCERRPSAARPCPKHATRTRTARMHARITPAASWYHRTRRESDPVHPSARRLPALAPETVCQRSPRRRSRIDLRSSGRDAPMLAHRRPPGPVVTPPAAHASSGPAVVCAARAPGGVARPAQMPSRQPPHRWHASPLPTHPTRASPSKSPPADGMLSPR